MVVAVPKNLQKPALLTCARTQLDKFSLKTSLRSWEAKSFIFKEINFICSKTKVIFYYDGGWNSRGIRALVILKPLQNISIGSWRCFQTIYI